MVGWFNKNRGPHSTQCVHHCGGHLDCGGNRSATPLWHDSRFTLACKRFARAKAPSPLSLCRRSPRRRVPFANACRFCGHSFSEMALNGQFPNKLAHFELSSAQKFVNISGFHLSENDESSP
jgi:hypothetical protein